LDSEGPVLEHCQTKGETVNSKRHCVLLTDELKPAIRMRRRGRLSQTAILQHNARPHTANKRHETIRDLKFELLEHPPYSPDLAPSDFHVSGPLKDVISGVHLSKDEELKNAVHSWLRRQPNFFFQAESQSWLNVGPSALKGGGGGDGWEIMQTKDTLVLLCIFYHNSVSYITGPKNTLQYAT
jgi:transposase